VSTLFANLSGSFLEGGLRQAALRQAAHAADPNWRLASPRMVSDLTDEAARAGAMLK